jgi:FkbH-like protein
MADLEQLGKSPDSEVAWLRLKDRYGELGLVCVGIIRKADEEVWEIDTFLMSCRVMGRGVEDAFLYYLAELAMSHEAKRIRGVYIKTAKNLPVVNFYRDRKFIKIIHPDDSIQMFEMELDQSNFAWPSYIERIDKK